MKWTKRKNGQTMATFQVRYHVPRDMVDWLIEHGNMSQAEAVTFIKRNIHQLIEDVQSHGTHDLCASVDGDYVDILAPETGAESYFEEAYRRYEGPLIVMSNR